MTTPLGATGDCWWREWRDVRIALHLRRCLCNYRITLFSLYIYVGINAIVKQQQGRRCKCQTMPHDNCIDANEDEKWHYWTTASKLTQMQSNERPTQQLCWHRHKCKAILTSYHRSSHPQPLTNPNDAIVHHHRHHPPPPTKTLKLHLSFVFVYPLVELSMLE